MKPAIQVTPLSLAKRFLGVKEIVGKDHNPLVVWMLSRINPAIRDDETAWCSAFADAIAWMLAAQRPSSLRARSWLRVGQAVPQAEAAPGFHVVIFQRGDGPQPGPEVLNAQGHVAFFDGWEGDRCIVIGGNQANAVTRAAYPRSRILGIREI